MGYSDYRFDKKFFKPETSETQFWQLPIIKDYKKPKL